MSECTCRICHYANMHSDQISAEPQVRQHHWRPERQCVAAVSAQSIRLGLQIMLQVNWWLKQDRQTDITRINYNCIAHFSSIIIKIICCLQCFDTVGWAAGRASGLLPLTHTHPFNGPLSGTIRVSRYQKGKTKLDFTEARDSEWQ